MNSKLLTVTVSAVAVFLLASCAETGGFDKTKMGAAMGAVAGAALGAAVADDDNQVMGALIGAAVGGLVGGRIGKMLDERDRQRLAQSTQETILTGEDQTWSNPETGVTATTTIREETVAPPVERQIPVLKGKVEQVPPLDFIGADYKATANANVRGGPGTDYVVVDSLKDGQTTRVIGKVTGANWYMVSENNAGSGFVSGDLLKLAPPSAAPVPAPAAPSAEIVQASVAGTSTCRVVTQQVTKNGQTTSEDVKACRGPNGWEIVNA